MEAPSIKAEPFFSVIVIFYNAQRFLREAIDSVIRQTEQSWELLLADDGSTDESATIARECANQMPGKIRYLHHPDRRNHGMIATRNLRIRHSRAPWIALLAAHAWVL